MKKIFITGGSGTVGSIFIEQNIDKYKIISYSRNEKSQVALKREFPDVDIILGSVEDKLNLEGSVLKEKPDIIIHSAAMKHVDSAEKQPMEMVKSNIIGSKNIIDVSTKLNILVTIGISTDKACNPNNLYGYSKLIMERMFLQANNDRNIFSCTRFGNVAGSNGSVIPFWLNCEKKGKPLPLTDDTMTRLMLDGKEVSSIIEKCINESEKNRGGFVLTKKMKMVRLKKLAKKISTNIKIVGKRPGEELYENLVSKRELKYTLTEDDYIYILKDENKVSKSRLNESFSSNNAAEMNSSEIDNLIDYVKQRMLNTMSY